MLKIITYILIFLPYFNSFAEIITTDQISVIKNIFDKADKNTLVIFDCHDVIFESKDRILQADNKTIHKYYWDKYFNKSSAYKQRDARLIAKIETEYRLLEVEWPILIEKLQQKGVKTILLTSAQVGKTTKFAAFEDIRYLKLLENNINFRNSWKNINPIVFVDLSQYKYGTKRYPIFKNGMLFTDGLEKGTLLYAFLRKIPEYKINKIIFVDNSMKHIYSVKKVSERIKAEYIGINYIKSLTSKKQPVDIEGVKKQFEILLKRKKWVTDKVINETYNKSVWIFHKPLTNKYKDIL